MATKIFAGNFEDIKVVNEFGVEANLGSHLEDQSLLVLGFYHCRHICNFLTGNLSKALRSSRKYPKVVFLSVDENEGPRDALKQRKKFLGRERGRWSFLISDKENIRKLATGINFQYKRDPSSNEITHEIGIYKILKGKIIRKFSSVHLSTADLEFSEKKQDPQPSQSFKEFCSQFNPSSSRYGAFVMKSLMGACSLFLVLALGFAIQLLRKA